MADSTKLYLMGIGVKKPGNAPLIEALLNSGADPNVYHKGEPVFLTAVRSGNLEVIKVFLDHRAASKNNPATSFDRALDINATDRNQQTALHKAITELDPETPVVKLLLDQGADASTADADGQTALHKAAQRNQTINIELLLDHGTDIAAPDTQGRTALHLAAERNHIASVKLLLARGAPIVPKTKNDKTPIQLAGDNGHRETFNVLREHVGLPAVEGRAYDPSLSNPGHEIQLLSDDGRQQRTRDERHSEHEFSRAWPDHAIQDRQTRERRTLTPNDARYWD
jgi:ankyrin repeat protein